MTISVKSTREDRRESTLAAGSVLALLGAAAYASVVALQPDLSDRQAFLVPTGVAGSMAASIGLALVLVALLRRRERHALWSAIAAVGLVFTTALTWFTATGLVALASHTTDSQFDAIGESTWLLLFGAPKMLLCSIGFLGLAIQGKRSGGMSTTTSVLLGIGAIASLIPPFPPGVFLLSIGLLLLARDERRHGDPGV